MIIDTKPIKEKLFLELQSKRKEIKNDLRLDIILSNDTLMSAKYVQKKVLMGKSLDIDVVVHEGFKTMDFESSNGVILQLPASADQMSYLNSIPLQLDVDCLTNLDKHLANGVYPPTIQGILQVLESLEIGKEELKSKVVVVIGQGVLVGNPLVQTLLKLESTVISCNQYTKDLYNYTKIADIIISATGVANLININHISREKYQILIDAGTANVSSKLVGDIDQELANLKNILLCPSPKGIGPLTVLNIFKNLLQEK